MQLSLQLQLPAARPLIPIEVGMVLLDKHEDELLSLIESNLIAWAWDIRSPEAERREIRMWTVAFIEYFHNPTKPEGRFAVQQLCSSLSEDEVIQKILPHGRPEIRSTELQRMLSCSQTHITNLIGAGLLTLAEARAATCGPNAFGRVTRLSVIQLLKSRRIA